MTQIQQVLIILMKEMIMIILMELMLMGIFPLHHGLQRRRSVTTISLIIQVILLILIHLVMIYLKANVLLINKL